MTVKFEKVCSSWPSCSLSSSPPGSDSNAYGTPSTGELENPSNMARSNFRLGQGQTRFKWVKCPAVERTTAGYIRHCTRRRNGTAEWYGT
eukprot:752698-Hanusia_phi.AAC.1